MLIIHDTKRIFTKVSKSTWLITELANQRARKALFTCVVYMHTPRPRLKCFSKLATSKKTIGIMNLKLFLYELFQWYSHANKIQIHKKGFALSLVLKVRVFVTEKRTRTPRQNVYAYSGLSISRHVSVLMSLNFELYLENDNSQSLCSYIYQFARVLKWSVLVSVTSLITIAVLLSVIAPSQMPNQWQARKPVKTNWSCRALATYKHNLQRWCKSLKLEKWTNF